MWWLCERLLQRGDVQSACCVFISNAERRVLMLRQRAGNKRRDGLIVWDYHVITVAAIATVPPVNSPWYVLDVDSTLPFPCPLSTYLQASFPSVAAAHLLPLFRLVPAAAYTAHFASDRSHMRREDGSWYEPPPSWPAIQPVDEAVTNNIQQYIDTAQRDDEQTDEQRFGRVLTMSQLIHVLTEQQQSHTADTGHVR